MQLLLQLFAQRRRAPSAHLHTWCAALITTSAIDGYLRSLEHLKKYGCLPRLATSKSASGQTVVDVFPQVG